MNNVTRLPDFRDILDACNGDLSALHRLLMHYNRYINSFCKKQIYDLEGNTYKYLDAEMKHELETELIASILKFKVRY